ncbi:MAG: pentapeptide repeat-containing protein [Candidatus Latescibacterota bacterium]
MKRIGRWAAVGALGLAVAAAGSAGAQEDPLVLHSESGESVLALPAGGGTSGPSSLPAGTYLLHVGQPGWYRLVLGTPTTLEVQPGEPPGRAKRLGATATGPILVLDFDLAPGDQGVRRLEGAEPGSGPQVQLIGIGLPPIYGWSATLEFDPGVTFAEAGFQPSGFVPGLVPLADPGEGRVEVGGASLSRQTASGDGDLGLVSLAVDAGAQIGAELGVRPVELKLRKTEGVETLPQTGPVAVVVGTAGGAGGLPGGRPPLAGAEAVAELQRTNACPGCDLSGAILQGARLVEADLKEANLSGANLKQADLTGADLTGANLTGAFLNRAVLQNAVLLNAVVEGVTWTQARLGGATWTDGRTCGSSSLGRCR